MSKFSAVGSAAFTLLILMLAASVIKGQVPQAVDFDPFGSGQVNTSSAAQNVTDSSPVIPQLHLSDSDISEAFQIISDVTGWSIFPTVEVSRAKISLISKDVTARQLLDTVVMLAGFIYHREGDIISVMTYDEYMQHYGLGKKVVSLSHADADSIVAVIRPFLTKLGKCNVHNQTNKIVLYESTANLETIIDMINQLDVPAQVQTIVNVVDLQYMDAAELAETLQKVFSEEEPSYRPGPVQQESELSKRSDDRITATEVNKEAALLSPRSKVGVYAVSRTNQLIVKAQKDDMEVLDKLIKGLDTYVEPMTRNYFFTYVDAAEIYNGLEEILDIPTRAGRYSRTGGGQAGQEGGRPGGITLVTKTNSIVLTAPPSVHGIMDSIVKSVDMPGKYEAGMIRSYKIQNADVDEVANAIKELIETGNRQQEKSGEPTYRGETPEGPVQAPDSFGLEETEVFAPQVEARVTVSKSTNSVIVLATARQHRELEKLIAELDVRRKQVLIKAIIVEATTTDSMDLGVELDFINGDVLSFTSYGLSTIHPDTGVRDLIVSTGGTAAVLRPGKVQAIFNALEGNENVRVESAPQVVVNDNAVGSIQSIAEEPTKQTNQGETTTTTSFGEYVTAGTQFFVTPHISDGNYLRVQYQIMLNSFGKQTDLELPPKRSTSTIQSEATVPDGSTIVVGGIQSSSETESVDKVPILGDIPIIGLAFRNTATEKKHITTYLFITTTIMKSEDFGDLQDVSQKALEEIRKDGGNKTPGKQAGDAGR